MSFGVILYFFGVEIEEFGRCFIREKDYNYKKWLRILMIMVFDVLSIAACGGIALLVRFEFSFSGIPEEHKASMLAFIGLQCVITVAVFMIQKMYH